MNGQRVLIAFASHIGLVAILAVDWILRTHLASVLLLTVAGALALAELYTLFRRMGLDGNAEYGVGAMVVLLLARGLGGYTGLDAETIRMLVLAGFAGFVVAPFFPVMFRGGPEPQALGRIAVTHLGLLLIWYSLSFVLELRLVDYADGEARTGLQLAFVLLLTVKFGDSCAYLVGKSMGTRPLTRISPRKTWEGAGGSLAGSVVIAILAGIVLGYTWWHMAFFGIAVGIAGQLGDLLESFLKRRAGVKDSGRFFRESGGFLDLVDSLILAAPVGYVIARFVVL